MAAGCRWRTELAAAPAADSPSECAVLDGGGFFDAAADTWHSMAQCLDRNTVWRLCHYERPGATPLGLFAPTHVAGSGEIWNKICAAARSAELCPLPTCGGRPVLHSEGTPDGVRKPGDSFYVSSHGNSTTLEAGPRAPRGVPSSSIDPDLL